MSQQTTQLIKELHANWLFIFPDWSKRIAAAKQLGKQRATEAVPELDTVIRENQNADLSRAAVEALGQIGDVKAVRVLAELLPYRSELHSVTIAALVQIGNEEAITALINGYERAQQRIEQALSELGSARTAKPLIVALDHRSAAIRTLAEKLLTGSSDFTKLLIAALGDENSGIRDKAGELLTQQGRNVVSVLIIALSDKTSGVQRGASEVLARMGAVEPLLRVLEESDERPALGAIHALAQIGEPAVKPLIERLTGQNKEASQRAGAALAQIGEPALPTLFAALDSDNETLCQLIIDQMCAITNMDRETLALRQYVANYHYVPPFKPKEILRKSFKGDMSFIEQAIFTDQAQEGIALQEFCEKYKNNLLHDERGRLWEADGPPNMARATRHLQRIQKINPYLGIPSYWLGIWHMTQQQSNQAISHFETALSRRLWPKGRRGKCHWWLGFAYTFFNNSNYDDTFLYESLPDSIRYDKAMPHFEQALKSDYSDLQFYREIYKGMSICTMRAEEAYLESGAELEAVMQTIEKKREIAQMWIEYNPEEAQLAHKILEHAQSQLNQADETRDQPQAFVHELRYSRAKGLINKGRFERAIKLLEALLAEKPQDNQLRSFLATVHVKGGSVPKGIAILKEAIENEPGRVTHFVKDIMGIEAHRNRVDGFIDNLIARKEYDEASAFLDECVRLVEIPDPEKGPQLIAVGYGFIAYRYHKMAQASKDLQAHSEALRLHQVSYDLFPMPETIGNLARCYREMFIYYGQRGNLDRALPYLHKSVEVDPDFVDGWKRLGIVYSEQERFKEASSYFFTCVELEPKDGEVWFGLGLALLGAGDTENAVQAISHATELGNPHAIKWMREALNR